ncbi:MAG: sulfotransferase [Anaerolineae bacterium]|nr:MAG: sulfotransferase [Anaerolineae bacterium]
MTTPFFIVGVHRSGTTLLRFMLSSHPRLYIPPESDFIPRFFRKAPQGELRLAQVRRYLEIIFTRYRFVEEWQGEPPDPQDFYHQMESRTPAGFLDRLYGLYAAQNDAARWGDKTPIYASYVPVLHAIFPQAQFIHIIRDPFDASISLLDKYAQREFHIDVYYAARNWVRRIQAVRAAAEALPPEQYLEIRYETLVQEPQATLEAVCRFLGEEFHPQMLAQHRLAQERVAPDSHFFANVRKPVNTSSLGRGRRDLSAADKRLIQHVAGGLMDELGYRREDLGACSPAEKRRLAFLRTKYEILQWGRRTATTLGLLPPI